MVDTIVLDSNGEPHTKRVQNPATKLAAQLETSMRAMLKELSATPASREKTRPAAPAAPKEEEYPEGSIGWLLKQKAAGLLGGEKDDHEQKHDDNSSGDGTGDRIALDFDV